MEIHENLELQQKRYRLRPSHSAQYQQGIVILFLQRMQLGHSLSLPWHHLRSSMYFRHLINACLAERSRDPTWRICSTRRIFNRSWVGRWGRTRSSRVTLATKHSGSSHKSTEFQLSLAWQTKQKTRAPPTLPPQLSQLTLYKKLILYFAIEFIIQPYSGCSTVIRISCRANV